MRYYIGESAKTDLEQAVKEATASFQSPKLILFFSGTERFEDYTKALYQKFPDSIVVGSTTFAAFCKSGVRKRSVLVLGIEDGIECQADVLEQADEYPLKYIKRVENKLEKLSDTKNTVCLTFTTAFIRCEEYVLSTLHSVFDKKGIPVFGGSAGDEGIGQKTMVSLNGKVRENSCVFVLLKNLGGAIHLYRENIYQPTEKYFTATKVDIRNRIVYEYNHKPAAKVVADALQTTVTELPKYLDQYPMGRIVGNEMYIVANQKVERHDALSYHARVYQNSKMVLLEPADYRKVIRQTLKKVKQECKKISLSIVVNCLARSMLFEKDGYLNQFAIDLGKTLHQYVGFSGYGEQLNQQHFNQTMIILVFE